MNATVFISHSASDHKAAKTICTALEHRGLVCWLASRDVAPGQNYMDAIVRAIRDSKVMVLVFSQNANVSGEILKELSLASKYRLNVIPARIEDVVPSEAFELEFATRQWIDLFDNWEEEIERLSSWVSRIVEIDRRTDPGASRPAESARPDSQSATADIPARRQAYGERHRSEGGTGLDGADGERGHDNARAKQRDDEHDRLIKPATLRAADREVGGRKGGGTPRASRRTLLIAAGLGTAMIAAVGIWWFTRPSPPESGPYGALATSPRADYGYAYNFGSIEAASQVALRECARHAGDCRLKVTFQDACLSFARANNGAMGWAWGHAKTDDDSMALEECSKNNGDGCLVAVRFCTGKN